jgi:hypothetical protein
VSIERTPAAVCFVDLSPGALARHGIGSVTGMITPMLEPLKGIDWSNRRIGIALALLTLLYIGAVIAFIILY